jgi:hypothetical protein
MSLSITLRVNACGEITVSLSSQSHTSVEFFPCRPVTEIRAEAARGDRGVLTYARLDCRLETMEPSGTLRCDRLRHFISDDPAGLAVQADITGAWPKSLAGVGHSP